MFKIVKNDTLQKKKKATIQVVAVLAAFVFAGIFVLLMGYNPIEFLYRIIYGAVGDGTKLLQTFERTIPLLITSMGILIAFKMKFWNIGGEGQIIMGALGATFVALFVGPNLPSIFLIPLMMIAGMIAGGIWALIPAFFKVKFGTNETIFTLMLNYIAINFVTYLQYGPWKDPAAQGFPVIPRFGENAILPEIAGLHIGIIFAIVSVVFVHIFINYTKKGYEITVVGESLGTAKYAGINIKGVTIFAMLLSGGLCGLAGMVQASAIENTLTAGISAGIGFTAIITTWIGKLKPGVVAMICFLFAMLTQGGSYVEISMSMPAAVAGMIQGLILFFVLGGEFFLNYKIIKTTTSRKGNMKNNSKKEEHVIGENDKSISNDYPKGGDE